MGIKSTQAYLITKDGKLGKKIGMRKGKYSHLDCDLTRYEEVLKTLTNK